MATDSDTTRFVATNAPDTQEQVQDLSAGWRNYICKQLNLSTDTFQLAQGNLGLQTTDSSGLFIMADTVPPPSVVGNYDGGGAIRRSNAYGMLLGALLAETNPNGVRGAFGDYWTTYVTWASANPPQAGEGMQAYYTRFGNANPAVDPGVIANAYSAYLTTQNSELTKAKTALWTNATQYQQTFIPAGGPQVTLYTYTGTLANAKQAIQQGAAVSLNFDTSSMDTSSNSTFASGSASGFYDIFSGSVAGSFEQLNAKAASSGFTITGRIGQYGTVNTAPTGWYDGSEVSRAYNAKDDNTVWDPSSASGTWDSFFGQPGGSLARRVSQLVLVSDYDITVTSKATYSQSEFQQIKSAASFGVWPFFSANASYQHTMESSLNESSNLQTNFKLNKGLIQIWGVSVVNAPS